MTTLQIRIDEKTKRSAQKVLNELGLDLSTAIKAYLKQIIVHDGIPMQLVTKNGLTAAEERQIVKSASEARRGKNSSPALSPKEAIEYLAALE